MQVQCTKCFKPIALADVIESTNGHLSHVDCKRPPRPDTGGARAGLRVLLGSCRRPMPGL